MKTLAYLLAIFLPSFAFVSNMCAQGTAMTYQGTLKVGEARANGSFDMTFTLYDSTNCPADAIAGPLTNAATTVSNGTFTVVLDFGAAPFDGNPLWLEIAVSPRGAGAFVTLSPRQPITSTPYSVQALNALNAASYSGQVADAQLSPNIALLNGNNVFTGKVNLSNSLNVAGMISGDGVALTNLNAATAFGSGNIPLSFNDPRILTNYNAAQVTLNGGINLAGANTVTGPLVFPMQGDPNLTNGIVIGTNGNLDTGWLPMNRSLVNIFAPYIIPGTTNSGPSALEIYGDYRNGVSGERYESGFNAGNPGFHTSGPISVLGDNTVQSLNLSSCYAMGQDTDYGFVSWSSYPFYNEHTVFTCPDGSGAISDANWPVNYPVFNTASDGQTIIWNHQYLEGAPEYICAESVVAGATNYYGFGTTGGSLIIGSVSTCQTNYGPYYHGYVFTSTNVTLDPSGNLNLNNGLLIRSNGEVSGNGSGLTNLNAGNLIGVVSSAQLPPGVAILNANQAFTGANVFGNAANRFKGDGSGLTGIPWTGLTPPAEPAGLFLAGPTTGSAATVAYRTIAPTDFAPGATNGDYLKWTGGAFAWGTGGIAAGGGSGTNNFLANATTSGETATNLTVVNGNAINVTNLNATDAIINNATVRNSAVVANASGTNALYPAASSLLLPNEPAGGLLVYIATNAVSSSNITYTCRGGIDIATSASTIVASNVWPFSLGSGTNQTIIVNLYISGNSANGRVNFGTQIPYCCCFSNNMLKAGTVGVGATPVIVGNTLTGPKSHVYAANSTGWAVLISPGSSMPTHLTVSGTVTAQY